VSLEIPNIFTETKQRNVQYIELFRECVFHLHIIQINKTCLHLNFNKQTIHSYFVYANYSLLHAQQDALTQYNVHTKFSSNVRWRHFDLSDQKIVFFQKFQQITCGSNLNIVCSEPIANDIVFFMVLLSLLSRILQHSTSGYHVSSTRSFHGATRR
jgi:hypothetical protein